MLSRPFDSPSLRSASLRASSDGEGSRVQICSVAPVVLALIRPFASLRATFSQREKDMRAPALSLWESVSAAPRRPERLRRSRRRPATRKGLRAELPEVVVDVLVHQLAPLLAAELSEEAPRRHSPRSGIRM